MARPQDSEEAAIAAVLTMPVASGALPPPPPGDAFCLRAAFPTDPGPLWRAALTCEQGMRPLWQRLHAQGLTVVPSLEAASAPPGGYGYGYGLVWLTRHKGENRAHLARAWRLLRPGGVLIAAGSNKEGAASILRDLKGCLGSDGNLSKYHCRVAWRHRPPAAHTEAALPSCLETWAQEGVLRPNREGYLTRPGLFSWQETDPASRLLVSWLDRLPGGLPAGWVADFGAGWGYLAVELLQRCPDIQRLDLLEAEQAALDAAAANLQRLVPAQAERVRSFWCDVPIEAGEVLTESGAETRAETRAESRAESGAESGAGAGAAWDMVVTNPPFHSGRGADPGLGQAFIAAACAGLRPGGRLLLVANRHLPYEAPLRACCQTLHLLEERDGFKLLLGRKG